MRTVVFALWNGFAVAPALIGAMFPLSLEARERPALLSGDIIQQIVPGATVHLDTPLGSVIPITYGDNGTLRGSAGVAAFHLGAARDRGIWWVENSKLCHKWKIWFDGKKSCIQIRRHGKRIYWRRDDGETGTATIVAQRLAGRIRPPPPRPVGLGAPRKRMQVEPAQPATATPAAAAQPAANSNGQAPATTKKTDAIAALLSAQESNKTSSGMRPRHTYRVVRVRFDDVLNIRRDAGAGSPILGSIPPNGRGIAIIGQCIGDWCPIEHKGRTGWVNRIYLTNENPPRASLPRPAALGGPRPRPGKAYNAHADVWQDQKPTKLRQQKQFPTIRSNARNRTIAGVRTVPGTFRVVRVQDHDVLNIRRDPTASSPIVAAISPRARGIRVIGACIGDWCPIEHRRRYGWANRFYIARERSRAF